MSLRVRLVVGFVVLAFIALMVAGGVTLGFAQANASNAAVEDLREQAAALSALPLDRRQMRSLRGVLRFQDAAVVPLAPFGGLARVAELPRGIGPADLPTDRLAAGETVSGHKGSLVYVAQPLTGRGPREVLVLTRDIGGLDLGGLGPWMLLAAAVALTAAAGGGAVLARRLTRPLAATEAAAQAIAAGDLSARVGPVGTADRELAAVARAFDDMAEELERSRSLTREFLMSVSHDLRTPLTSIRGYAEALAEGTVRRQEDRRHAAAVIEGEARRLERLVSDLLDLARLDARRFTLDPRPTDPGKVVANVAGGFGPVAAELGVSLEVETAAAGERDVDPERLGQVVANLVENALRYAAARVEVRGADEDGRFVLEVVDDGPGIAERDAERVFERLYTSRPVEGRKVGTGLGLAIVHELVTAMGGTVETQPSDGGARFRVTLP